MTLAGKKPRIYPQEHSLIRTAPPLQRVALFTNSYGNSCAAKQYNSREESDSYKAFREIYTFSPQNYSSNFVLDRLYYPYLSP